MADPNPLLDDLSCVSPAMLEHIVLGTAVRLERNLEKTFFPHRASDEQRLEIEARIRPLLLNAGYSAVPLAEMGELHRRCLAESGIIPADVAEDPLPGTAYAENAQDATLTALVNDHAHITFQAVKPGFALEAAWAGVSALEAALDGPLAFAWDEKQGYFTASPGDLGTGLRVSTTLHLFGLRLTNELDPVLRGLERMRFAVRGAWNENAVGQVYTIMNLDTLGVTEEETLSRIDRATRIVTRLEYQARLRLLYDQRILLEDCLFRTLGLLSNALLSPESEALELLSALRMMAALKMIKGLSAAKIDGLIQTIRPAHFIRGNHLPDDPYMEPFMNNPIMMMDFYRAAYLRDRLEKVSAID